MKLTFILGVVLAVAVSASAVDSKSEDLTTATAVKIVDQRVPDLRSPPITITDSNTVAALARAIQNAPGKWKKGLFTAPAGYKRFAFVRDSQMLAVIGLGDRFMVRGGGGDWGSKKITKELEDKIAAFGQQSPPNTKSLEATRDCVLGLSIVSQVIARACSRVPQRSVPEPERWADSDRACS